MECGPSNAIQNLAKHSQRDTLLQNQFRGQQPGQARQFRQGPVADPRLNREFAEFAGPTNAPDFTATPIAHQSVPRSQIQPHQPGPAWVEDFGKMKLESGPQQGQTADWSRQFQQSHPQMGQMGQMNQPAMTNGQQMRSAPMMGLMGLMYHGMPMASHAPIAAPQFQNQLEHQQNHKLEQQEKQFADKFAEIEQELAEESQQQHHEQQGADDRDLERDQFARIAQEINTTVGEKTLGDAELQAKFAQLGFMNLMHRVANKQVELDGDQLRDTATGEQAKVEQDDTTVPLSQPVSAPLRLPDYHAPMHEPVVTRVAPPSALESMERPEERPEHQNKLPDPLAHIADGALADITDPLMMAQVVLGGQVQRQAWLDADVDWMDATGPYQPKPYVPPGRGSDGPRSILNPHEQEVFDDYRHDDDYH